MSLSLGFFVQARAETGWRVELDQFEGPLALLLQLIKQQKLDILDIPVALIARQYIAHLESMQPLDPEVAADYLFMAATLLRLKAQMLLPSEPEADEETGDPRLELALRLLEYRRFKETLPALSRAAEGRDGLFRVAPRLPEERRRPLFTRPIGNARPPDLAHALHQLVQRRHQRAAEVKPPNPITRRELSVDQRVAQLREILRERQRVEFAELCAGLRARSAWVVTFLAILELVRRGEAHVEQEGSFRPLLVKSAHAAGVESHMEVPR